MIHGYERPVSGSSNPRGRRTAGGIVFRGGQKFKWMPSNRESHKEASDVIFIHGNGSPVHNTDVRNYNGDRKLTWVPVRCAESEAVKSIDDLNPAPDLKAGQGQLAESVENSPGTRNGSVQQK